MRINTDSIVRALAFIRERTSRVQCTHYPVYLRVAEERPTLRQSGSRRTRTITARTTGTPQLALADRYRPEAARNMTSNVVMKP